MLGRNPASVLPAPVAATSSALRPALASRSISSWCRRGCQPLDWIQSATTGGRRSFFSFVGPLAPPRFFLLVEVVGCLLSASGLAGRTAIHDQPYQHDQKDDRAQDFHDAHQRFVHFLLSRG